MKLDEDMLSAFVDGELDPLAEKRVEAALNLDVAAQAFVRERRAVAARLSRRFDPILEEPVPDHLRIMLDTNVLPLRAQRRSAPMLRWPQAAAIAATLAVGIVAVGLVGTGGAPSGAADIAQGDVASALQTQLASVQDPQASTRIGVSFAATDGRLCRTFETSESVGLACREDEGWHILSRAPRERATGDYRQAGSGSTVVMQQAQDLMAGEPFDAEQERRAAAAGWRAPR